MKTTITLASLLISSQLMAADIYEFKRDEWEPKPAPAKTVARPAPAPTRQAPVQDATVNAAEKTAPPAADPAVVQVTDCVAGAACNDL